MLDHRSSHTLGVEETKADAHVIISISSTGLANTIRRRFVLFVAASVINVEIEHIEAIGQNCFLLGRLCDGRHLVSCHRQRHITLVLDEADLAAFIGRPAHHAGARKQGVVHTVGRDESITAAEDYVDDVKVVDVLHVGRDLCNSYAAIRGALDEQITSCAVEDFVVDVPVETVLVIRPLHFDLPYVSSAFGGTDRLKSKVTRFELR